MCFVRGSRLAQEELTHVFKRRERMCPLRCNERAQKEEGVNVLWVTMSEAQPQGRPEQNNRFVS
jgi:hypothetical protein